MNAKSNKISTLNRIRIRELKSILARDPGFSCQGKIGEFIGLYIQSEVYAKKILQYYRKDTNKIDKGDLHVGSLKAAIKYFKLPFSNADTQLLFKGGNGARGNKSARQLRNRYLHTLSDEDKNEITSKSTVFSDKLNIFLRMDI